METLQDIILPIASPKKLTKLPAQNSTSEQ
jgi:hypothetical protein